MPKCAWCGEEFKKEPWMEEGSVTTTFCSADCYIKHVKEKEEKE